MDINEPKCKGAGAVETPNLRDVSNRFAFARTWVLTILERAAEATRSALPQSARLESLMVILVVLFVLFVRFLYLFFCNKEYHMRQIVQFRIRHDR